MARRARFMRSAVAIPERMGAPTTTIDGPALRQTLTEIANSGNEVRSQALALFKKTRSNAMAEAQVKFEAGQLGGLEMARLIAAIHDEILLALYDFTTMHIIRASNPTASERMAVCAVGGYGRGEMAPGSDLDLLFLLTDKKGSAHTESVTEYMLYMLWDVGLKVGHSARTIPQCITLAKTDQTILTALLDVRFLCGDEGMAMELFGTFRKQVTKGKGRDYIAAKLAERDVRHEREGNSRYVIEPNIKEGKGGLRDLHVLYWIARFLDKDGKITDPQKADDYVTMGLFEDTAASRFVRAADFLWRTRIHLHFSAGRPTEGLSFDYQTVLARKMGYASGPIEEAVEKFMREYFINAREVGALTRIACAKLEAEKSLRLPKGLDALLPNSRRDLKEAGFLLDHGRLNFKDDMQLREKPALIMELFEIAGRRNLDIHPDALTAISFRRNLIDNNFRRDPNISQIFQNILLEAKAPYATLKVMNDSGVLGRYLLEFGGIVARTQFNMAHAYTVDEHTLRLVNYFHDLESGIFERENPVASKFVKDLTRSQKRILYMACLLHDTGKGVGDQCIEGARLSRRACRRLSMDQAEVDTVSWLVRHHLDMSETAQRRDISDGETIAEFGAVVGSQERLNLLFLLTIVDIRAVGPGIWNDWKGVLLRDLYQATTHYLDGRDELEPAAKARFVRQHVEERLPGDMADRTQDVWDDLKQGYWLGFDMTNLVRHARFFDQALLSESDTHVHTRLDKPRDITELWVLTRDRDGLFADLSLGISSLGAQIVGARLHTGHNDRVMNVFYLQNNKGLAFGRINTHKLDNLRERTTQAAMGDVEKFDIKPGKLSRRAAAIPVKPRVKMFPAPSGESTIIEIEGRDRPGLLFAIATCLKEADVSLLSAHIEVVGTNAVDAFYVVPSGGEGELSPTAKKALKTKLLAVLNAVDWASAAA